MGKHCESVCVNGHFWISIQGDHYAIWERELDRSEILSGALEVWNGGCDNADLRCCFRLDDAKVVLHCADESKMLMLENGVIKVAGVRIEPMATSETDTKAGQPIVRIVERYDVEAYAGCDNESYFDSKKLIFHTEYNFPNA